MAPPRRAHSVTVSRIGDDAKCMACGCARESVAWRSERADRAGNSARYLTGSLVVRGSAKRVLIGEVRVQGFSLKVMAGLFVAGGVSTSPQMSVTPAHFLRHLDFGNNRRRP